jgi:hypothetical protein
MVACLLAEVKRVSVATTILHATTPLTYPAPSLNLRANGFGLAVVESGRDPRLRP